MCREWRQRDEGARAEWGTRRGLERQGVGPWSGDGWRSLSGLTGTPQHWPRQCLTQLLPPQSHYVACMAAILSQMDKDHYSSYIQAFPSRAELMVSAAPRSETWGISTLTLERDIPLAPPHCPQQGTWHCCHRPGHRHRSRPHCWVAVHSWPWRSAQHHS